MSDSNEIKINYTKAVELIYKELLYTYNYYSNLSPATGSDDAEFKENIAKISAIYVYDEQSYVKPENVDRNAVYVAVKFGTATMNFGASVAPITLRIMGTSNAVKPAQFLFNAFVSMWTTKEMSVTVGSVVYLYENTIQVWSAPNITANFNNSDNSYRSLFAVSGTIVFSKSILKVGTLTYYYDPSDLTKNEEVLVMSYSDSFQNNLAPQPFGNTDGYAVSVVNFSTFSFSISTYSLDNHFTKDLLLLRKFKDSASSSPYTNSNIDSQNANFIMKLNIGTFTNMGVTGIPDNLKKFKVASSSIKQELGGIPMLAVSFSLGDN